VVGSLCLRKRPAGSRRPGEVILQEFLLKLGTSLAPNLGLGLVGYFARVYDRSGLVAGVILGTLITYAFGWGGFLVVLGFVVVGEAASRIGLSRKPVEGTVEGTVEGQVQPQLALRTWRQVAANLAVPAFGALVARMTPAAVLKMFFTAAVAAVAFDAVASEMGKAFGGKTVTLHDMRVKEAGVSGGISLVGTGSGVIAAVAVALVALGFGLISPVGMAAYVVLSALLAAAAESLLKSAVGLQSPHLARVINALLGGLFAALFWTGARTL